MISLILPTRKRPDNIRRFVTSALETAKNPKNIEFCFYIDNDDEASKQVLEELKCKYVQGERIVLSQMWNEAYKLATGDILGHMGDDIIFRSKDWDEYLENTFKKFDDRILFAFGDDGYWHSGFGTHGFIHRNWVETIGYFVPPYFSSDFNDTWLNDVAKGIERWVYIPEIYTEHMHYIFQKSAKDETYQEREDRGARDNVMVMYMNKLPERENDIKKLKVYIEQWKQK